MRSRMRSVWNWGARYGGRWRALFPIRKTLTVNNGSEFIEHGKLARRLGFKTRFADPCAFWQRGGNENTNGLIRQYFPKKHAFAATSHQRVARIAHKLNNFPRKCLAYRTPDEVLAPALSINL